MIDCIHDWSFINKHVEGTPYVPLFKCDKCAEVLEDWDAADYISHLENLLEERDALIERLVEAGSSMVADCQLTWENAHIPVCTPVENWREVVAEHQAMKGGEE